MCLRRRTTPEAAALVAPPGASHPSPEPLQHLAPSTTSPARAKAICSCPGRGRAATPLPPGGKRRRPPPRMRRPTEPEGTRRSGMLLSKSAGASSASWHPIPRVLPCWTMPPPGLPRRRHWHRCRRLRRHRRSAARCASGRRGPKSPSRRSAAAQARVRPPPSRPPRRHWAAPSRPGCEPRPPSDRPSPPAKPPQQGGPSSEERPPSRPATPAQPTWRWHRPAPPLRHCRGGASRSSAERPTTFGRPPGAPTGLGSAPPAPSRWSRQVCQSELP
mmetsp:Transcript_136917/g.438024  ORF Transcript_136917/g.438024 Transcript_136917/m.438024 type:complete len:274 (+) Transcript_136917:209-1030(+)